MIFSEINNNDRVTEILGSAVRSGSLHHAYILEGPGNADKKAFAKAFAKAILCREDPGRGCGKCSVCMKIENDNHIDITFLEAEGRENTKTKSIKDENIKKLQERLNKKPFDGERNIAVICDADTMSPRAANRLLKTLEEPPEGTVIMVLSENVNLLPMTIRSRCVHCRIMPFGSGGSDQYVSAAENMVEMLGRGAPFYRMKKSVEEMGKDRETAYVFLDHMEKIYEDMLRDDNGYGDAEYIGRAVEALEKARREIMKNISADYALKNMLLEIGG